MIIVEESGLEARMPVHDLTAWLIFVSALVAALTAVGVAWRRWVGPALCSVRDGAALVVDGVNHIREVQDRELMPNGEGTALVDRVEKIGIWAEGHDGRHSGIDAELRGLTMSIGELTEAVQACPVVQAAEREKT